VANFVLQLAIVLCGKNRNYLKAMSRKRFGSYFCVIRSANPRV